MNGASPSNELADKSALGATLQDINTNIQISINDKLIARTRKLKRTSSKFFKSNPRTKTGSGNNQF